MRFNAVAIRLNDLLADRRGNVLMITAASLIPLLGMLGGAFDLGRVYLVRTRLQQACDSAVLAGRAAMGSHPWSSASQETANRYFTANFNRGRYGSMNSGIAYTVGADQSVHGRSIADVPMAIMHIFGYENVSLDVVCDAKLELPNVDIMFVLDTTLSMSEKNAGDTTDRITALKSSVQDFHSALENSRGADTRVRYGFVPYSATVNVGMLLKPEWLVDRWTYQSRVPDGTEQVESTAGATTTNYTAWAHVSGSLARSTYTIPPENCVAPANTATSPTVRSNETTAADGTKTWTETQTIKGKNYSAALSNGICTVTEASYTDYVQKRDVTQKPNPNAGTKTYSTRYWWKYLPVEYDVRPLKAAGVEGSVGGGSLTATVADNHADRKITWNQANACIEERRTSGDADPFNAPSGGDVDIDTVPTAGAPDTQWRPSLPGLVYSRRQTSLTSMPTGNWGTPVDAVRSATNFSTPSSNLALRAACPAAARKLAEMNATALSSYLSTLRPAGLTYHDIGFIWGLRLLSAQGLFASENQAPATGKLARHLIFMTDGQTDTNIGDYDAYGLSALDRRRTPVSRLPTATEQNTIVETRLTALCGVARAKGITVWVIAFGTSLTPLLSGCAADEHAFEAKDAAELQRAFTNIAGRIAQLRLVR